MGDETDIKSRGQSTTTTMQMHNHTQVLIHCARCCVVIVFPPLDRRREAAARDE